MAWASSRDQHHSEAVREFERFLEEGREFELTTDVFDETVTLCLKRHGHRAAVALGQDLRAGAPFHLLEVGEQHRDEAWAIFRRHSDHPLSHTDCTSIAAMRRLGIAEVFSFDSDFDRAGLIRRPR